MRLSDTMIAKDNDRKALLSQTQGNRNIPSQLPSVKINTPKVARGPISLSPAIREYNKPKPKYKLVIADNINSRQTPTQRANKTRGKGSSLSESVDYSVRNDQKVFKYNPRMIGTAENFIFKGDYMH